MPCACNIQQQQQQQQHKRSRCGGCVEMVQLPTIVPDDGKVLSLETVYTLVTTPSNKLDIAYIKANHKLLNQVFTHRNQQLSRLSNSTPYPFKNVAGNANIVFQPLDLNKVVIRTLHVNDDAFGFGDSTSGNNAASSALDFLTGKYGSSNAVVLGHVNIVIGPIHGNVLGEASTKFCVVDIHTVGSNSLPNPTDSQYAYGKTMVHEVGHMLSLVHPFLGSGVANELPCIQPYADITKQKYANNQASIDLIDGKWQLSLDNRYRDCVPGNGYGDARSRPYGCYDSKTPDCKENYEFCVNIMDYANDSVSTCFSRAQCNAARQYVLQNGNIFAFTKLDSTPDITGSLFTSDYEASSNAMSVWLIMLIVTMVVIVITWVTVGTYVALKKKK